VGWKVGLEETWKAVAVTVTDLVMVVYLGEVDFAC
jgi:hypothetical protein